MPGGHLDNDARGQHEWLADIECDVCAAGGAGGMISHSFVSWK